MAYFFWAGNKNIPQGQSMGFYERPIESYDWGRTGNWFIKNNEAVGSSYGYVYEDATRTPETGDSVNLYQLSHNPAVGLSGDYPTNELLFGGISAASGGAATGPWYNSDASGTGNLIAFTIFASYGNGPYYMKVGNTFGSTFGNYWAGNSASTVISGLTGLSGNTQGSLQLVHNDGSAVIFGVSAGISYAGSNENTIGTKYIYGNTWATRSVQLAISSAITAGLLRMQIEYGGQGATGLTLTQNKGGGGGNTEITGTLITGSVGTGNTGTSVTAGISVGNTGFFIGGDGVTRENCLRILTNNIYHRETTELSLVDSICKRCEISSSGAFNYKRGSIEQFIQRRRLNQVFGPSDPTSTYLLDTVISNSIVHAGGTYMPLNADGIEGSANRPVTYIRSSGGIPTVIVRAFRKGLVQIVGNITTLDVYPEQPHVLGENFQGRVELTRRSGDTTMRSYPDVNMKAFNDENMIAGSKTNNTLIFDCGATFDSLDIGSGLAKVGANIGDNPITVVDGNISGLGHLMARSEYNTSYDGFRIGGTDFPVQPSTGGVTLPEGILVSDPEAEIEFSTGHYVLAAFFGTTSADDAFQKPIPYGKPGTSEDEY